MLLFVLLFAGAGKGLIMLESGVYLISATVLPELCLPPYVLDELLIPVEPGCVC